MHIQKLVKFCHLALKIFNSITNVRKMMCIVAYLHINAYTKVGNILSICFQDIERKQNMMDGMTDGWNNGQPNPV